MAKSFLIWLLATALLIGATPADAQQTGKVYRVGRLGVVHQLPHSALMQSDTSCASLVTSRVKTSFSSCATQETSSSGCPH
jgi:hypothetical protein